MIEKKRVWPFLFSAMFALSGCSTASPPDIRSAPNAATQNSSSQGKGTYPELAGYPLRAKGEFATQTGQVKWMNYTDFIFNPRPMEELFRYLQDWSSTGSVLQIPAQKPLSAKLSRRPGRNTDLYLIPRDAPVPGWWVANPDAGTRVYYYPQNHEESTTIVRVIQPVTSFENDSISDVMNNDAEAHLAVEACQSSVRLDAPGEDYRFLQEVFCNSVKLASFMRKNDYPYELYAKFAILGLQYDRVGKTLPFIPFSSGRYYAFSKNRIISGN